MKVTITERGWPAHYVCAPRCLFRRNTLVKYGEQRVVVSTVGGYILNAELAQIAHNRYYETMAFKAEKNGEYWDADTHEQFDFTSPWAITGESVADLSPGVDNEANEMHEAVVKEIADKLETGALANEV